MGTFDRPESRQCEFSMRDTEAATMFNHERTRNQRTGNHHPSRGRQYWPYLLLLAFWPIIAFAAPEPSVYVRVNQVGYEQGAWSRAYVMSSRPLHGVRYRILDDDRRTVLTGTIGAQSGIWGHFFVYPIDFTLSKPGSYLIQIDGTEPGRSPVFAVDEAEDIYSTALAHGLSFYQNERDGRHFVPSALRSAPGHLNDESAKVYLPAQYDVNDTLVKDLTPTGATIDASGGWWDAGDYVKFLETASYTVGIMLTGIRDFPEQMGRRSHTDFTGEGRFGLDWLRKMWDDKTRTLYYQVGLGNGNNTTILADHDIWRLPQADDTYAGTDVTYKYVRHRPVLRAGRAGSHISPNLAGRMAAAFALAAQVFRYSDPDFARECLISGEHIFDLADTSPRGDLLTASPFDSYPETEWRDDMEWGATELYLATRDSDTRSSGLPYSDSARYLRAAAHWAKAYITGPNDAADTLNLYDLSGLAHFELVRALDLAQRSEDISTLEISRRALLADLKKELDAAVEQSENDPFQFGFVWNVSDTATHGAGLAVEAKEYATLTGSSAYDGYSRRWMANILGANAWGSSFIVGDGSVFPDCMQHQVANLVGSLDGSAPRLDGALVEGPNSSGSTGLVDGMRTCPVRGGDRFAKFDGNGSVFIDNVQSYATVEPAVDLTAASLLMFAWRSGDRPDESYFQEK